MDPSAKTNPATNTPAAPAAPHRHVRAVPAAPRGQRFGRPRRYADPAPPQRTDRRPSLAPPAPGPAERGALPPWLSQVRTELAPEARDAVRPTAAAPAVRRSRPAPAGRPRTGRPRTGRDRQRLRRTRRPRRWTGPRFTGCETVPYTCTILGLLLAAHLLGLIG
ncbi:hypothetical protein J0910_17650 [Nocardiopsis sp. CNT-189]|uniref:hypothetical protein n=1 Tax=Nocardiopsis oceanisediminis TaxID=2816862 RepID=UPI003B379D86